MSKPVPVRAVVARFTWPVARQVVEEVMRRHPFEYCASIAEGPVSHVYKSLPAGAQDWFESAKIRGCDYGCVDWDTLMPLDAGIIAKMRDAEAVFMDTVSRLEWKKVISFAARKRWYLRHLQFWNDYLTRHRINLYLSAWMPHEIPDVLIHQLCILRGIPALYFHTTPVQDVCFSASTWEDPAPHLREAYERMLSQSAHISKPEEVELEPLFEERYQSLIPPKAEKPPVESVRRKSELDKIKAMAWQEPLTFTRHFFGYMTPKGIGRALTTFQRMRTIRARKAFYDAHAIRPDLDKKFIYLPLHFQPEASTTPMAGCFTDQILVARMLNAVLPDDVLIYVKEHPRPSGWTKRSLEDYKDFLALKKVRLVAGDVDTFALREKCVAVATCSGSAGFEALFREKPVLLFGNRFYQYANGIFRIELVDDCKRAMQTILAGKGAPTLVTSRLFLKAMQESGIRATLHPLHAQITRLSEQEHVRGNMEAILSELSLLAPQIRSASASRVDTLANAKRAG